MERHAPKNTFGLAISILGQRQHAIAMAVWFVGFFALYSFISGFWLFPGIGFINISGWFIGQQIFWISG